MNVYGREQGLSRRLLYLLIDSARIYRTSTVRQSGRNSIWDNDDGGEVWLIHTEAGI